MQGRGEQRLQAHPPVRYALGPPLKRGWPVSAEGVVSIRAGSGPTPLRYGDKKDRREQRLQAHPPVRYALGPPLKRGWSVSAQRKLSNGGVMERTPFRPTVQGRREQMQERREQVLSKSGASRATMWPESNYAGEFCITLFPR